MKRIPSATLPRRLLASRLSLGLGIAVVSTSLHAAYSDTYYVNDHLATTVATIDAIGEIAALEADAFGSPTSKISTPDRYTGKPYDEDLAAFVFPFRNYRSVEARWISADPSGFPDGTNNLCYGTFAPTGGVDAWGLAWHFVGQNSNGSYPTANFTPPIELDGTSYGSYTITGFSNGIASSLTLTISATTSVGGLFQTATATATTSVTLNINKTSGEVTMSGLTKDDVTDYKSSIGRVNAAFNLGIQGGQNVTQGQIAFGHLYNSGSATANIGFTGAGLAVGVTIPLGMDWSRSPTLSFSVNKAE